MVELISEDLLGRLSGGYHVYVLRSLKDNGLYKGMTSNLSARLKKHNAGGVPSTRHRRPLVLVCAEWYATRLEASSREKFFKSGPGHKELMSVLSQLVNVPTVIQKQTRPDSVPKEGTPSG